MKRFANLIELLTRTEPTRDRIRILADYFSSIPTEDASWAIYFLLGRRPKRLVTSPTLREWALQHAAIPRWLFEESYKAVGDLGETIALLVYNSAADHGRKSLPLSHWMEDRLLPSQRIHADALCRKVCQWWSESDRGELYLLNKLLTGTLRFPIPRLDVVRSISQMSGAPITTISLRLGQGWQPSADHFRDLISPGGAEENAAQPFPFLEPSTLEQPLEGLGSCEAWLVEWMLPGIRAQLVRRANSVSVWSKEGECLTKSFSGICRAALMLPEGTVLDGKIVSLQHPRPPPVSSPHRVVGEKRILKDFVDPSSAVFMTLDLLEENGRDVRNLPLVDRRRKIEGLLRLPLPLLRTPPVFEPRNWSELREGFKNSRQEGHDLMLLRRLASKYMDGPSKDWWEWHFDPMIISAVLVNVKADPREGLSHPSEYTLAVWEQNVLIPLARIPRTQALEDFPELIRWIVRHTTQRFGSTYTVEPHQVLEVTFDDISPSSRHKSGFVLRAPRITGWLRDKPAVEAGTLDQVARLANVPTNGTSSKTFFPPPKGLFDQG
jgi:DNA ligase-1